VAELVTGLSAGAAYALVAVGIVLIFKGTRALSFAQGEIGAFGLFLGYRWADRGVPGFGWHLPLFMTMVVAILVGAALGFVVERVVMRPLVRRPPLDGVIATLGIALFLALLEKQWFGVATQFAPSPVGTWRINVFGATLTSVRVVALLAAAAVAAVLYLFFERTRFGLGVRATTDDATVARLLGVPVNQVYRFAWVIGGALAGLAAALLAPAFGGLTPFAQTSFSIRALAGAVIGGLDSVWGAIAGSLAVGIIETYVKGHSSTGGADTLAVLILVVATLVVRPRGLFGTAGAV
jgi:branched-chain amino acid transport system permease protein